MLALPFAEGPATLTSRLLEDMLRLKVRTKKCSKVVFLHLRNQT